MYAPCPSFSILPLNIHRLKNKDELTSFLLSKDFTSMINCPIEKCFPVPLGKAITTENSLFQKHINQALKF